MMNNITNIKLSCDQDQLNTSLVIRQLNLDEKYL